MPVVGGAATNPGNRGKSHYGNVLLKKPDGFRAEAGEQEWGFNGMDVSHIGYRSWGRRGGSGLAWGTRHPHGCIDGWLGRAVHREHFSNGCDSGDWFFAELAYSVGQRAQ